MATQKEVDVVVASVKKKLVQHNFSMAMNIISADQFADIAQYAIEQLDDYRTKPKVRT